MQLFYNPDLTKEDSEISFEKDESRHIVKVLRKKIGDTLELTNGKGYFFEATLMSTNPKQCIAQINSFKKEKPLPYSLHLAVAPTKLNDRFEWFLEKATEIGISEITPIICDHSERKVIKPERYEKIMVSAAKQSLKAYMPKLNNAISFSEFLTTIPLSKINCIAHCEETKKQSLKDILKPAQDTLLLIGPEGDFSVGEIEQAVNAGFIPVTLGASRLRTETAAIVACHSVAFINE